MHLEKGTFVMKKALYGTTALVAAAVVAGQADAASGLKLGITGYYRGAIGATFGTTNQFTRLGGGTDEGAGLYGRNNVAFRQEVRVNFTGSTTLDNGITVGVLVGLNAGGGNSVTSNASARINRAYMDLSGKFGQIRFGDANSAYQSMCVGDPGNVTANFGLNSPNESFGNAGFFKTDGGALATYMPTTISGAGTCFGLETRSTKLIYFSPTFGGFNFAVSFAPDHVRSAGGSGGLGGTFGQAQVTGGATQRVFHDFLSAGVNFNHDFGGVTLSAGVSGEWALGGKTSNTSNASGASNKPSMYQAGFQVGFGGGWAVGASGQYVNNYTGAGYGAGAIQSPITGLLVPLATASDDAYMITAGGSYTIDAISVGLEGLYNHYAVDGGGGSGHLTYYGVSLNGAYALGPGISLEGQFAWTKAGNNLSGNNANAENVNAYEFDIGTAINF
jgi:outer membrane protein OmpU